ncbi:MAG TPA: hypothetical protein VFC74_08650 [Oscillospiraceae bacterium]|nr:hypothetical protein [Oscillospiraceae bacterium]
MKNFKWQVAVCAFVLTLGLAVGAVMLRQRQVLDEPLRERLGSLAAVETVELDQEEEKFVVRVKLAEVKDLALTYRALEAELNQLLAEDSYRLVLVDERNSELTEALFTVSLALYEGEQRGNFTEMSKAIAATLEELQVAEHRLTVDHEHIYLQMKNGDAYLYEVVGREPWRREGERV